MLAGAGVCPVCAEVRWLRAGPTTTPCDACAELLADMRRELRQLGTEPLAADMR